MRGREALFIFYAHYKTSGSLPKEQFNQFDLVSLKMRNNDLHGFHREWKMTLNAMEEEERNKITRDVLRHYYYKQIKNHKSLELDMRLWDRMPETHPDKNYEYLYQTVENQIDLGRQANIDRQRENGGLRGPTNPFAKARGALGAAAHAQPVNPVPELTSCMRSLQQTIQAAASKGFGGKAGKGDGKGAKGKGDKGDKGKGKDKGGKNGRDRSKGAGARDRSGRQTRAGRDD